MAKTKIKNKQLIEAAKSVPIVAEQEQWVLTLDREEGTLFYSPDKISDRAELHQVTDEYALYLDKNFKPKGVMIEGFRENFLKHHRPFRKLSQEVFDKPATSKKNAKLALLTALLESTLIKEAGSRLIPA